MSTPIPRAKVLLVDDRPENLLALEAILEPVEVDTVRAQSGEEALRALLSADFAVILLDVQMPGMNGFETARMVKSRERSRHTPIIFLTAINKEDEFVFEGYSVGAVDYMFKPFNPDILRSKVGVFVDLYTKGEQLKAQEQLLRDSERREIELRHHARLLESEARMAEIVNSAMEAIITFDEELRITLFNSAAERMFGYLAQDAVGQPVDRFFSPALRREQLDEVCTASERRARGETEPEGTPGALLRGVRSGGETFPVEASISCLALPSEKVYTVIARDVSERVRSEEALREQAASLAARTAELKAANEQLHTRQAELENAMAARSRFYASMSHELRTPINAILGYSTLLLDNIYGPLRPEQANGIERAHRAGKHLLELVNDILDLSKIEAGKMELEVQPVVFPALVQELFVTVRPLAAEHGSELALEADEQPVTIVSDPRRVRQILLNLLSNAIKFGEGRPIQVRCGARPDGGVEVSVRDEGAGISAADQERIFEEFVQLSPGSGQGTGLGLPISRRLASLLDAELRVDSAPGEGSTFTLVLPASVTAHDGVIFAEVDSTPLPPPPRLKPQPPAEPEPKAPTAEASPPSRARKGDARAAAPPPSGEAPGGAEDATPNEDVPGEEDAPASGARSR